MSGAEPLRVAFLVHELGRSGGMGVIRSHARALRDDGRFAPELLVTGPGGAPPADLDGIPVRPLSQAPGERFDHAIATWWQTAAHLWTLAARRRSVLLQSFEERFYAEEDLFDRVGAAAVTALPLDFIVVAAWMRDLLAELRPDARCLLVRNGIDKRVFSPRPRPQADGPLRVLVEGQPTVWFKAVEHAARVARAACEPATLTVVAPEPDGLEAVDADRRECGLGPEAMAALYAEHDVLLKLSRVESLGLPPLEAFHVGTPALLAPFTGHEEYAEHGRNCLVAGFDDEGGAAAMLDLLARDPGLRARLSEGALATAARWPSTEDAGRELAAALLELDAAPPPDADAALRSLERLRADSIELGRPALARLRAQLAWREEELAGARDHLGQLERRVRDLEEQIEAIGQERAYRFAVALRKLVLRRPE